MAVADQIRERMGECGPAERRVARALLARYPAAGLETVAQLAKAAEVSAPTVIRFVQRLGFRGHPEFQKVLLEEIETPASSPLPLYDTTGLAGTQPTTHALIDRSAEIFGAGIRDSLAALPPDDLQRAIDLVADPRRRVLLTGGRMSGMLARYLATHLAQFRDEILPIPEPLLERSATLASLSRRDTVVVFDFQRYDPPLLDLGRYARGRGAKLVLFTDARLSPVATMADSVLPSSQYESLVPALAIVETMIAGVLAALGEAARQHVLDCDTAAHETGLY
ncbi:MurR/RpiR family transcriptional regulator [Nonomuraea sediminis]|uniref:MurR/RpiR family transcriptional regulator n=1 Tax=Nonomuraea sediminis TaxID=2835864 RepID=UPI001BDD7CC1|nr:MurR/RpiR family transcriptional regulator [Nonomuraea sediminis]